MFQFVLLSVEQVEEIAVVVVKKVFFLMVPLNLKLLLSEAKAEKRNLKITVKI